MYDYKCPFGVRVQKSHSVGIQCSVQNTLCGFQRYCPTKRDIEHSPNAQNCLTYKKEINKNRNIGDEIKDESYQNG